MRRCSGDISDTSPRNPASAAFLEASPGLSDTEVGYLTNPDGEMHVALVAVLADSPHEALGVARFVRLAASPEVAEPALAVVDPMQGHGLGKLRIERLIEAARERGVERFRWVMLADNPPIRHLVEVLGLPVRSNLGSTITVEVALDRQRRSA